jgi:DNA polymerase III epsilon subunit-like protein
MKYFLDFEANQFSDRIISIGCIAENGNTYSTLVNPKEPIAKFIINLTGINDELVSNAPNIEKAINDLYNFFIEKYYNTPKVIHN